MQFKSSKPTFKREIILSSAFLNHARGSQNFLFGFSSPSGLPIGESFFIEVESYVNWHSDEATNKRFHIAEIATLDKEIYNAYINQGNHDDDKDNKEILSKILNLRVKKAKLLGYENHASLRTENRMAQNPERVFDLLNELWDGILPKVKEERAALQEMIDKDGGNFKLEPHDWFYYTEKLWREYAGFYG